MKKKILYAIFVICIVFIAGCGTKENADFVCESGNVDVDKRVEEIVELVDDNEKIESMEWVEENRCYRVRIQYIDTPKGEYEHKRDYFFYVDDEIGAIVVTYPSSDEVGAGRRKEVNLD